MHDEEIRDIVLETLQSIAPEADLGSLEPVTSFRDQIDIDSMDFLNFMIALEKRLDVRIREVDYPKLSSLDGCLTYLRDRSSAGQGA